MDIIASVHLYDAVDVTQRTIINANHTDFSTPVGIDDPSSSTAVEIYPNPVSGIGTIVTSLEETRDVTIDILDLNGRYIQTAYSGQLAAGSHTVYFNASKIPNGVYIVRVSADSDITMKKIIVTH